jgi:hypothetical protein
MLAALPYFVATWLSPGRARTGGPSRKRSAIPFSFARVMGFSRWASKPALHVWIYAGVIVERRERHEADMRAVCDSAHPTRECIPVHVGHQEVTEHEVRALRAHLLQPALAVFSHINSGAEMGQQRSTELAVVIGVVFHEQDVHAAKGHKAG